LKFNTQKFRAIHGQGPLGGRFAVEQASRLY